MSVRAGDLLREVVPPGAEVPTCKRCGRVFDGEDMDRLVEAKLVRENGGYLCHGCSREAKREYNRARVVGLLAEAGVPARYRGCSLESWRGAVPAALKGYHGDPDTVFLWGTTGTGKTHLATAVLREWAIGGRSVAWRDVPLLTWTLRGDLDKAAGLVASLAAPALLVLDDLGAERQTDYVQDALTALLRRRLNGCKATILTSNVAPEAFGEMDPRLASRLAGGVVLNMSGPDRRLGGVA